jgi:hypothetical protein
MATIMSYRGSDRRFGLLRGIAAICSVVGGLMLVLGALLLGLALYAFLAPSPAPQPQPIGPGATAAPFVLGLGATLVLLWSGGCLIGGLQFLAAGAFFRLMIQLEENTRATAQLLDEVRARVHAVDAGTESIFIS